MTGLAMMYTKGCAANTAMDVARGTPRRSHSNGTSTNASDTAKLTASFAAEHPATRNHAARGSGAGFASMSPCPPPSLKSETAICLGKREITRPFARADQSPPRTHREVNQRLDVRNDVLQTAMHLPD